MQIEAPAASAPTASIVLVQGLGAGVEIFATLRQAAARLAALAPAGAEVAIRPCDASRDGGGSRPCANVYAPPGAWIGCLDLGGSPVETLAAAIALAQRESLAA